MSLLAKRHHSDLPSANQFVEYFLTRTRAEGRPMSAYKLQKLLYYTQAWSLAERDRPAFREPLKAWKDGPVAPGVYRRFQQSYYVHQFIPKDPHLSEEDKAHAEAVWLLYRERDGDELSEMTHHEQPWIEARRGLRDDEHGNKTIDHELMRREAASQMAETMGALSDLANSLA